MRNKLAPLIFFSAIVCFAHFSSAIQDSESTDASADQPSWELLNFGQMRDGSTYEITKITLTIPKNSEQIMLYGLDAETLKSDNKGPLQNPESELNKTNVTDTKTLRQIEESFLEFMRLETNGSSVYGQMGSIEVSTNKIDFTISISERGFVLGDETPTKVNTFYNWTLAKLIDDQLQKQFKSGLKKKYFDLLSGQRKIDALRDSYERTKAKRK